MDVSNILSQVQINIWPKSDRNVRKGLKKSDWYEKSYNLFFLKRYKGTTLTNGKNILNSQDIVAF